jgi:hypothetical protein
VPEPVVVSLGEGLEFRVLPVDALEPHPDNPNIEDLAVFNELVEGIKAQGMIEPVLVVPHGPDRWRIIGGEHRWKAAKLAGLVEIPAIVKLDWDETTGATHLVRMNVLRGKIDPERFVALWGKLKQAIPDPEMLKRRIGLGARDAEFRRLVKGVTRGLPAQVRVEVERRSEKIRRVEDLATVVQSLFARYGATIDAHFVLFSFGGATHLMVRADDVTFKPIADLAESCAALGVRLDEALALRAQCSCAACELKAPSAPKEP